VASQSIAELVFSDAYERVWAADERRSPMIESTVWFRRQQKINGEAKGLRSSTKLVLRGLTVFVLAGTRGARRAPGGLSRALADYISFGICYEPDRKPPAASAVVTADGDAT